MNYNFKTEQRFFFHTLWDRTGRQNNWADYASLLHIIGTWQAHKKENGEGTCKFWNTVFFIRILSLAVQAEYYYFSADNRLKIVLVTIPRL